MAPEVPIEQRLSAIEEAVAELQRRLPPSSPTGSRLDRIIGSFKDEPAFEEVLAHGRAFRSGEISPKEEA